MDEPNAQAKSASYRLAVEDTDFLLRDEMRAIRFALEYAKAEFSLRDWGIRSTIIVFGGARVPSPEQAELAVQAARTPEEKQRAERLQARSAYYQVARDFGRIASERGGAFAPKNRWRDNVIATGGGPGIMEAANRGAFDAGAPSIGFNITLPVEQKPNPYITPELSFRFHYFAMRKMHLAMRANALAIFPGGFGTMDELFELLTLQQTSKAPPAPIVLFGAGLLAPDREFRRAAGGGHDLALGPEALRVRRDRRGGLGLADAARPQGAHAQQPAASPDGSVILRSLLIGAEMPAQCLWGLVLSKAAFWAGLASFWCLACHSL